MCLSVRPSNQTVCVWIWGDKTGQTVQICTTKRGLGEICALTTASQQLLRMYLFAVKVRATNQCQYLSTFPLENDPKRSLDSCVPLAVFFFFFQHWAIKRLCSIILLAAKLLILAPPGEMEKPERRQALNGMEATMDTLVLYDNLGCVRNGILAYCPVHSAYCLFFFLKNSVWNRIQYTTNVSE